MDLLRTRVSVLAGCVSLALIGCGGEPKTAPDTSSADAVAQREKALEEREAALTAREEEEAATARREARERKRERRESRARKGRREEAAARRRTQAASADSEASGGSGGDITVPDVVGLDHQAAQDALQGEGLYSLDEEDCTGQDRALLFDRNWEVESTDPTAGSQVSATDTITLCSKKRGE